jgi:hypothetical protein
MALGEDCSLWMCLWSVFFALVLNVESGKLGWLEWWWLEDIYSPNHYSSYWLSSLSMATSDSPVHTRHYIVHCPVRATSAGHWGLEQSTVDFACHCGAPDSPVWPNCRRLSLTFWRSELVADAWQSTVGEDDRCSWAHQTVRCTLDSLVNFSRRALIFPESGLFVGCASLGTGHCPVHHRLVQVWLAHIYRIGQGSFFLIDVYEFYTPEKRSTSQTS